MAGLLLVKVTLVFAVVLAVAHRLRRAPAAVRHRFWSGAFPTLLVLPLLAAVLPGVALPVPAAWARAVRDVSIDARPSLASDLRAVATTSSLQSPAAAELAASTPRADTTNARLWLAWPSPGEALFVAWAAGTVVSIAALLLALLRVRRTARAALHLIDEGWRAAADDIGRRLGLRRSADLLLSRDVGSPMAGGILRPAIFLPIAAPRWPTPQRDAVLAHEIAHLVQCDPWRHVVMRITLALYWFHPLAWIAARQATLAREESCDDSVLSLGTRPSAYAQILLDFAGSIPSAPQVRAALPMAHTSMLEKRLMAILKDGDRTAGGRSILAAICLMAAFTLVIAVARPRAAVTPANPMTATESVQQEPAETEDTSIRWNPDGRRIRMEGTITVSRQADQGGTDCSAVNTVRSFRGSLTISDNGMSMEQIGSRGSDWIIFKQFADTRVCLFVEGVDQGERSRPSRWVDGARRVLLATTRGGRIQRLEITRQGSGPAQVTWSVAGLVRPLDRAGEDWRAAALTVLDTTWELSSLHGQVSSLRGEISSILGERSSLQGEISSLRGEVSSMQGEISSVRGEESSLRGEVSSILGELSSLRGAISAENGAISSLQAQRYGADAAGRARISRLTAEHEKEIDRLEREIAAYGADARVAAVEKEIARLDADRKVAAIEARIKAFDAESRVASVQRQIAAMELERKVGAIERQIDGLDVDRRSQQLEERRAAELKRLESAIAAIR